MMGILSQNAIFSVTSYHNGSYHDIDKPVTYCRFPARALQPLGDEGNFKITLQIKKAPTQAPKFQSSNFSTVCEG